MPVGKISSISNLSGAMQSGGTKEHDKLLNRNLPNQHPISAIAGLEDELLNKLDSKTALPLIEEAVKFKAKGLYYDALKELAPKSYWYLTSEINPISKQGTKESIISGPYDLGQGGGGGGGVTTVSIKGIGWPESAVVGGQTNIRILWSSVIGEEKEPTGNGTLYFKVNGKQVAVKSNQPQGEVIFDISAYIVSGTNTIQIQVMDSYGTTGIYVGTITGISLELKSNFNYRLNYTNVINYTYVPYGDIEKIVHFIVDGEEYGTQIVRSTGEQQTFQIKNLTHGSHVLEVYFSVEINGVTLNSNILYYDLIYYVEGNSTPIIASEFREFEQEQYIPFNIPYRVFIYNKNEFDIDLLVNGNIISSLKVNTDEQLWEFSSEEIGNYNLQIKCGETVKDFSIHIKETSINVRPVLQDLELALSAQGRSNVEPIEKRSIWEDTDRHIACNMKNFNWASDGWLKDISGNTVLRITGDARVEIPFKPFENDCRNSGKTIELEIATSGVRNYESTIISCIDKNSSRGFYITPQLAVFKSQQSSIQTQYKEDDHIRITFVIEKNTDNRIIWMYINGIASGAVQYPVDDSFRQLDANIISLGSNDATLDIYNIRVYANNLTSKQVVNNWIADTQISALKAHRYYHNQNYNDKNEITVENLKVSCPDLPQIIWDIDPLPQYKGDKRKGNAYYTDFENTTRSFTGIDGDYNVQGTSSAAYPVKNIRLNMKKASQWYDDAGETIKSFKITEDGIGANYFTYKVDFASSEGANNVELVRLYNDAAKKLGILNPAQKQDNKVRVGIDGFPVVAFHRDAEGNDIFCTKANFNNDKANENVYGFMPGDESWEITNNSADEGNFKAPATPETFANAFEIRFPDEDGYSDLSKLGPMTSWVVSTNPKAATGVSLENPIQYTYTHKVRSEDGTYSDITVVSPIFTQDTAEYRKTKFRAELKDWFDVDSTIFYYIFTHLFLMIDSRAKNAFPTYFVSREENDGGNRWFWLPYDMDTAIGINNEGKLVFDYSLEDTDKIDGANVFNGQDSVMWNNLREMFDGEIGSMYAEMRKSGNLVNFDYVEEQFEAHQNKWSENLFNEDSYNKYIVPLASGDNYLEMLQGNKSEQRRWWLYNRFKYLDSKYLAGDAKSDFIQFRAYAKADVTITPYADIYATVSYANSAGAVVSKRAKRGEAVIIENPLPESASDQETYIYSASQLKSIGDLSPFYPDTVKVGSATKLQELKVGDASPEYNNTHLTELTLGNNTLLRSLDVRNCSNLEKPIDISGCTNIEEVYFTGTKITGINLPSGGTLKHLHLPESLTKLTLKNLPLLTDLVLESTENIESLWLENIPSNSIDAYTLISSMKDSSAVRLIGIKEEYDDVEKIKLLYNRLDAMKGMDSTGAIVDKAQVTGNIYIDTISYADYISLQARYEEVKIIPSLIICTVKFMNEEEIFNVQHIILGKSAINPGIPEKTATQEYYYVFNSWDKDFTDVQSDLTVNAIYDAYKQSYTVTFDSRSSIIKVDPEQETKEYGSLLDEPTYEPHLPGVVLIGWYTEEELLWNFETDKLYENITLYAKWQDEGTPTVSLSRVTYDTFSYYCEDNVGITAWTVSDSNILPESWTDIQPISPFTGDYEIDNAQEYYFWVKDAYNNTSYEKIQAFNIFKQQTAGISKIELIENDLIVVNRDVALRGTRIRVHVDLGSHYENLQILVDDIPVVNDTIIEITSDTLIKATCVPKIYTVDFELFGKGAPVDSQEIVYNNKVEKPLDQYFEGEVISGWYTSEDFDTEWDFKTNFVSDNMTLFAKWTEYHAPTKITVDIEEANTTISINYSQEYSKAVKVYFGDDSEEESSEISGIDNKVSLSHTYVEPGEYIVEILGNGTPFRIGGGGILDNHTPVVVPSNYITSVEFSWDVSETAPYAFAESALTSPALTNFIYRIAEGMYYNCSKIEKIELPNSIIDIGLYAFKNCNNAYGELTLSKNIKSIGDEAFMRCELITKVNLSLSENIVLGSGIFKNCISLSDILFNCRNITLGDSMFEGCQAIEEINIPESICLGNYTFTGDQELHTAIVASNKIGIKTFADCINLRKVIFTNTELSIGNGTFDSCRDLTSAGPINSGCTIEFAWMTKIPDHAFASSSGLTQSGLKNVILPIGILEIGDSAFKDAPLSNITLPDGLEKIGEEAFFRTPIAKLDIPESVFEIGPKAFAHMAALVDIKLRAISSSYKVDSLENSWFYKTGISTRPGIILFINRVSSENPAYFYGPYWNSDQSVNDINWTTIEEGN